LNALTIAFDELKGEGRLSPEGEGAMMFDQVRHPGGRPPRKFNRVEGAMLRLRGLSYRQIAKHFGVSKSLIHREIRSWVPTKTPTAAPVIPPMAIGPTPDPDLRPIDWDEEARTDLSPRTPGRIQFLLRFETPAQIQARILNDGVRYRNRRG
jgi:hypothetical protein